MSKRMFIANSWLQAQTQLNSEESITSSPLSESYRDQNGPLATSIRPFLPPIPTTQEPEDAKFKPSNYFIPGWSGSALFSKPAMAIKKLQEKLWKDAIDRFKKNDCLPLTLSQSIHNEFVSEYESFFSKENKKGQSAEILKEHKNFWDELRSDDSFFREELEAFVELYCFRLATIYLFKLKFLISFSKATGFNYTRSHIINPSTFYSQLFQKSSSGEISCESFKKNQYSWYRPNTKLAEKLEALSQNFAELSVTQLMKISSFRNLGHSSKSLDFSNSNYSHALSNKLFGQFLNQLLVFFPLWQNQESFKYPAADGVQPEILNTKFIGDHIESLGQSHWLAQEGNMHLKWSEIICPEFVSGSGEGDTFVRVCQELQFLTFLTHYSLNRKLEPQKLISKVTREKYSQGRNALGTQFNLFNGKVNQYDRVVLNIGKLPKKNPHHHLITQINNQMESLNPSGQLVVLSNQKLFVPSQSKKIATLLKDFKVDGLFNFEKLKGRGEVSNYVFILSKRDPFKKNGNFLDMNPSALLAGTGSDTKQDSCFTFRFEGELSLFSKFESFNNELHEFFKNKSSYSTSVYQRNLAHNLTFEFHQDAIIDGKLLSSLNKESDNITHPHFFKNLTENCCPFESLFNISELGEKSSKRFSSDLLGIQRGKATPHTSILIIDLREPLRPELEICVPDTLQAKQEEYGTAYFHYYGLTPKIKNLNLNLLREFFESNIGKQITQICLSGSTTKLKGKLRSLLIPNFLAKGKDLSEYNIEELPLINTSAKDLLNEHPDNIKATIESGIISAEKSYKANHFWLYLSLLAHTKLIIKSCLEKVESPYSKEVKFTNPLLIESLVELPTFSIYPNEEVYTELLINHKLELQAPLTHTKYIKSEEGHSLEVVSQDRALIRFHGEEESILFINFILSQAKGMQILEILQNLEIPKYAELKETLSHMDEVYKNLNHLYGNLDTEIKASITKCVAQV